MTPAEFLFPLDLQSFRSSWGRRSVHIRGGAQKFSALGFDLETLFAAADRARGADAESIKLHFVLKDGTTWRSALPAKGIPTRSYFDHDASIVFSNIEKFVPSLANFLKGIQEPLALVEPQLNCYCSPAKGGFRLHFDDHSVIVMQIAGTKRWRYSALPDCPWPIGPCIDPVGREMVRDHGAGVVERFAVPRLEEMEEVLLQPGDVLHLPPGTFHQAEAVDFSLGLTLTHSRFSFLTLLAEQIRTQLNDVTWRKDLLPSAAAHNGDLGIAELEQSLAQQLDAFRTALAGMSARALAQTWLGRLATQKAATPARLPGATAGHSSATVVVLSEQTTLVCPELHFVPFPASGSGDREVSVHGNDGSRVALDESTIPLLHRMVQAGTFSARDVVDWMGDEVTWDDAKPFLETLLFERVIVHADGGVRSA